MKSLMLLGRRMEEEEEVKLGIGIGVESYVVGSGDVLFTAGQLHELEQQARIYKYMAAGLAVPFHLLAPILESVAVSLRSSDSSPYKKFPSFMPFNRLDQMDPAPGRCRRTDGKKWRCGRNVVPHHKYCEQHVHRGRMRSRKPVENSEVTSPTSAKKPRHSEGEGWNSTRNIQISPQKSLQLTHKSFLNTSLSQAASIASSDHHEGNKNITSVTNSSIGHIPPAIETATSRAAVPTATVAGQTTGNNSHSTKINLSIGLGDNISNHGARNCMLRGGSNTRNSMNVSSNASPGLGFSQDLLGSNGIHLGNKCGEELEPGRCKRTDGMKCQSKREVLPVEKYCSQHTRRGAKRQAKDLKPVAVPSTSAATTKSTPLSQATPKSRKTDGAVPSTNLSISIPANSSLIQNDEKSYSSSDSDTTITDTSLAPYDSGYVSS